MENPLVLHSATLDVTVKKNSYLVCKLGSSYPVGQVLFGLTKKAMRILDTDIFDVLTLYALVLNVQLRARFIRAVSELQFLGFVKPTKRKTDHVARLTWEDVSTTTFIVKGNSMFLSFSHKSFQICFSFLFYVLNLFL